ncbi:MAG: DUF3134 domain-containing protein [Scytolyngbya sp. HA4215-MV1]|nr:DUF3134 domain-containing protein [Scytolyngbya sp. HA4215-MV1]
MAKSVCYNPALTEEPRNQPIKVVPLSPRESLLGWLERTGRLHSGETDELLDQKVSEDLDEFLEPDIAILEDEEEPLMD